MLSILEINRADQEEWADIWARCDYATYFHSPEWMLTWEKYYDGLITSKTQRVTFSDGKSAVLIISAKTRLNGWFCIHESSPGHSYGGWISIDDLTTEHSDLLSSYLCENYPNLIWRINPFNPHPTSLIDKYSLKDDRTFTVPLNLSWKELHGKLKRRKILKKVKSAEKHNLTLRKLQSNSVADYQKIYKDAQARWNKKGQLGAVYDISLFESFFKSNYCDFWGVFQGDELICAGPVFRSKTHVACWLTLAKTESLNIKPYEFFYYYLIHYYKEREYTWFDFNPSGGLRGLEYFKEGLATTEFSCPVLDTRSSLLVMLQNAKSYLPVFRKKES